MKHAMFYQIVHKKERPLVIQDDHEKERKLSGCKSDERKFLLQESAGMLHAVMLGSGLGRGRNEWYPEFYLQRRQLGCRMNRGEQETLFRQSRQLTRIMPSHEDLVLSVLKSPISQHQQQQRQQYHHTHHSHEYHVNCQGHQNHRKCTHSGTLKLIEEIQFILYRVTIERLLAAH
ncbi:hypothetical protein WN51_03286 [Melipona quadrifasciata]|uniref:Uncharacterized protein n=1 Tax=Melipona quadrifasciata TaxID=166423 RepID=A0A0M8ZWC4_9HYME|nr:hypothetical protein WN51_03286 [Melipona quadrifasciata]